jgi:hypothetical protein
VKFHSNQTQAGQFTAVNAGLRNDQQGQDDTKPLQLNTHNPSLFLFFIIINQTFCHHRSLNVAKPKYQRTATLSRKQRAGSSAGMNA